MTLSRGGRIAVAVAIAAVLVAWRVAAAQTATGGSAPITLFQAVQVVWLALGALFIFLLRFAYQRGVEFVDEMRELRREVREDLVPQLRSLTKAVQQMVRPTGARTRREDADDT